MDIKRKDSNQNLVYHSTSGTAESANVTVKSRTIAVNVPLTDELINQRQKQRNKYKPLQKYPCNKIQTSKYNIITFIPKNLFEQFRKVANSFFLLLIILQCLPEFYTVHIGIVAFPMAFIVALTAIKDGIEDYKRHQSDISINGRLVEALAGGSWRNWNLTDRQYTSINKKRQSKQASNQGGQDSNSSTASLVSSNEYRWENITWESIMVGDIIRLSKNDAIPADMIILSTSEQECACFVETKNLDGETNLKLRQGLVDTQNMKNVTDFGASLKCLIESEIPSANMNNYQGTVCFMDSEFQANAIMDGPPSIVKKVSVGINGVLLRGTVLKNTEWAVGVVVATGVETKQILNAGETPSKQSEMEKLMNKHIAFNLVFMFILCFVCSLGYALWTEDFRNVLTVYGEQESTNSAWEGFKNFWHGLILFQSIVPISLYISIEFVKTFQAYFIHQDLQIYHEETDTPCNPKTWNLSDNLGQIEYIFSDKTGTLTRNIMEFKKCSINGILFDGSISVNIPSAKSMFSTTKSHRSLNIKSDWVEGARGGRHSRRPSDMPDNTDPAAAVLQKTKQEDKCSGWYDEALYDILEDPRYPNTMHGKIVDEFFQLLALCHTVLVDTPEIKNIPNSINGEDEEELNLSYKAQSPDEACLVTTAAECGYVFLARKQDSQLRQSTVDIQVQGETKQFILLQVLEFDSDRKRMSVIVKNRQTNEIIIYCKGADSVIFERLAAGQGAILDYTTTHLEQFAEEGLRTLCLAYRILPANVYDEWYSKYQQSLMTIYSSPAERSHAMELLNNEIEREFILLGATAIEDKLQDGVPDCITSLMRAGIKVWVLTGDKMETAINIGFLCGLLKTETHIIANGRTAMSNEMILIQIKSAANEEALRLQLKNARQKMEECQDTNDFALIIDGMSLKYALDSNELTLQLLEIACSCKTAICCRVSPLQKAQVVQMVKDNKKVVTLAIGDGANDVSMIQAAHVGVGISGEEGLQAAMSADYAIAQFRFLKRLLLVHGRWSYSRNSYMILNFYLKSLVFSLVMFWYQMYCGFSSSIIYEFTFGLFYNTIFTSLPITILALFDRDLSEKACFKFPEIYKVDGISQAFYTTKNYSVYMLESIWHSLVIYYVVHFASGEGILETTGFSPSQYHIGTIMAVSAIVIVNLSPVLDTNTHTIIHQLVNWMSFFLIFIYVLIFSAIPGSPIRGLSEEMFSNGTFWFCFFMAIVVSLGPRFVYYASTRHFSPTDDQICQEDSLNMKRLKKRSHRPGLNFDPELNNNDGDASISKSSNMMIVISQKEPILSPSQRHPITFDADNGTDKATHGFSFSHTFGMAGLMIKNPMLFVNAAYQSAKISTRSLSRSNTLRSFRSQMGSRSNTTQNNNSADINNSNANTMSLDRKPNASSSSSSSKNNSNNTNNGFLSLNRMRK